MPRLLDSKHCCLWNTGLPAFAGNDAVCVDAKANSAATGRALALLHRAGLLRVFP